MTKPRILIDLDCTVVDFQRGACAVHGIDYHEFLQAHVPGEYGTHLVFGRIKGSPMTQEQFWEPISADPHFWLDLEPLPWAQELFALVKEVTDDWEFVTSHSRCPTCVNQKEQWLLQHFGREASSRMTPCRRKYLMAKPGVILVDDNEQTCVEFAGEMGHSVVFPALHNSFHEMAEHPMRWVVPAVKSTARWCGSVKKRS